MHLQFQISRNNPLFIRGFSLVEIMVSLVVLAILMALVIMGYSRLVTIGDRTQCQANIRALHLAAVEFITDRNGIAEDFPSWQQWYFPSPTGFREYFMGDRSAGAHDSGITTVATSPLLWKRWKSYSPVGHTYARNYRVANHGHKIKSWQAIEEPHRMMHFMYGKVGDEKKPGFFFYTPFLYGQTGPGDLRQERYYDEGFSSIVYMDGRVDRISREEGRRLSRANTEDGRLFWLGVR